MSRAFLDGLDEADRLSWRRTSNSCGIEYFAPHISAARTNGELAIGSFEAHARDLQKPLCVVLGRRAGDWDARAEGGAQSLVYRPEPPARRQRRRMSTELNRTCLAFLPRHAWHVRAHRSTSTSQTRETTYLLANIVDHFVAESRKKSSIKISTLIREKSR